MQHLFGAGRRIDREYGAVTVSSPGFGGAVQRAADIDQTGEWRVAVRTIPLKGVNYSFAAGRAVQRKYRATAGRPAGRRRAVENTVDGGQSGKREIAVLACSATTAKRINHLLFAGRRVQ